MRDDRLLHTPQKDHPRSSNTNRRINGERNQKQQQQQQKLGSRKDSIDISAFSDVFDDIHVAEYTQASRKDSINVSTFSEAPEDKHVTDPSESVSTSLSPFDSPSSVHQPTSSMTLLSSTNTAAAAEPSERFTTSLSSFDLPSSGISLLTSINSAATAEPSDLSVNGINGLQSESDVAGSLEMELVVRHLQQLKRHCLSSADSHLQYKKLLDGLVDIVIEEFCRLPEERNRLTEIISRRSHCVILTLILWILVVSTIFLFGKFAQRSYSGPSPT